jgi:TPR repeat protein
MNAADTAVSDHPMEHNRCTCSAAVADKSAGMNRATTRLLALPLLVLPGCNKTVGDTLRPEDHTAAAATGAELTCDADPGRIKPLVVDWSPDERVDLEAAMQGSVVVVKYACPTIEILPGCGVDGSYSYAGVSRKEQVVQMKNMDEVRANIPVSSGNVGGEVQSGRAIDLATVLVGRRSTTVNHLSSELLNGQCDGATHFVRSASLGAFAMATGSVGKAAVVAEMFGVGAGAKSESDKQSLNKDGDLSSCRESSPDAGTPPPECRAPIRIELMPIATDDTSAKEAAEATKKAPIDNPCLPGYVFADGLCTLPADDVAYVCDSEDETECKTECDKGSAESCLNYGRILADGARADQAMIPFKKACDEELWDACTALGEKVWYDSDAEQSNYKDLVKTAFDLVTNSCDGGHGYGCELTGDILNDKGAGFYDQAAAFTAYARSCDLGSSFGCYAAATAQLQGLGIPVDVKGGLQTLLRSCQGGNSDECHELGVIFAQGKYDAPKDTTSARGMFALSCQIDADWCESSGEDVLALGDASLAAKLFERDCQRYEAGDSGGCAQLGLLYMKGEGVEKDESRANELLSRACEGQEEVACKALGRPVPE